MSQKNLTTLQSTLKESFYYLGNQQPLPEGCGWTSLDGKQMFSAGVTLADSAPTVIPFTVVGCVATNLNNTGLFGTWSRNSKYGAATAHCSFQLGPPLDLGFCRDWAPAMARLKELQLAGANNSRKVQYLFVHENVPPQDCILRAGARDVEDGEENQGVHDAIPKDKKDDPAWINIVETKNFAVFPLYDESGDLVPLRSVQPTIAGATILLTFSFCCWRFEPTDPFSFAADVERVDVLIPANVRLSLPPTLPKTPQQLMQSVTPSHRVQALYTIESEDGMEFPRNSIGTMVTTPSLVPGAEDSFASGNELQHQYNQYQNSPTYLSECATLERRRGPEVFQPQSLGPVQNAPLLGLQPAFNPVESRQLRDTCIVGSFSESWSPPMANPHIHSQDGSSISTTKNMDSQSRPTAVSKETTVTDVSSSNSNKSGGERVAKRKQVDDSGGDVEQQHEPKRREIDNGMTAGLQE
ncbi:hypothetical protein EV368DRAFT_89581 [Lentinula lateritia]|nr:hypothetical protein EV368DRAFT_89581 [Lentinula lateritia]